MTYCELKQKIQKEITAFEGIFFAFSDKQFKEGMEKIGLTEKDIKKIYRLPGGGFIRKDKSKNWHDMFNRHEKEKSELLNDYAFLLDALSYELSNHEYCITYDVNEALESLGLTIKDLKSKKNGLKALEEAKIIALQHN